MKPSVANFTSPAGNRNILPALSSDNKQTLTYAAQENLRTSPGNPGVAEVLIICKESNAEKLHLCTEFKPGSG